MSAFIQDLNRGHALSSLGVLLYLPHSIARSCELICSFDELYRLENPYVPAVGRESVKCLVRVFNTLQWFALVEE